MRKSKEWGEAQGARSERGQAMVEYLLMLVFALGIVAIIASSFRHSIVGLWGYYIQQISAACPGCAPNPSYRFR